MKGTPPHAGRIAGLAVAAAAEAPPRLFPLALLVAASAAALLACGGADTSPAAEHREGGLAVAAMADVGADASAAAAGALGEGFVVWESNRTGAWRIWSRRLDGSGLRQLSPEEAGRNHCCAHIAPDGSRIAYLSHAGGERAYPEDGVTGALRLVRADGSEDRVIAPAARSYLENRAVVWRNSSELIYIGGAGRTMLLDLVAGGEEALTAEAAPRGGWLVDATLAFATTGEPTFSPYDARRRRVARRSPLGGCQPYFSRDGRWGYWTAGAGGPIRRLDLASREVGTILEKNDPRLPAGHGYLYFPMLSADGLLLAVAASRSEHDHFRADYDVFVFETDPRTLEALGPGVRLTTHPATDRFPDVWSTPLVLGRHFGEAPFTVRFDAGGGAEDWRWNFGDGSSARGARAEHSFATAGVYTVRAERSGATLEGRVRVEPASPPTAGDVALREGGREVVVRFSEPIRLQESAAARFASGRSVAGLAVEADGRSLRIDLAEPLRGTDRLTLSGVEDRADRPNRLVPVELEVGPLAWPGRRDRLAFVWESGEAPNLVPDPENGAERACVLTPRRRARLDHNFAMALGGGYFAADPQAAARLREACQDANEFSLEAIVVPPREPPAGLASVVAFASPGKGQNLRLLQRGDRLVLSLRTGPRGPEGNPEVELMRLSAGRPSHIVVSFTPGGLQAYLDGERVVETEAVQGDLFHWRDHPLTFGGEAEGGAEWSGTLEGVAIYARALGGDEARETFLLARERLGRRPKVERAVVEARLVARSPVPSLEELSPYREALSVHEYEVERVIEGDARGRIRVAHWSLLDGQALPVAEFEQGQIRRLVLEPFDDNPQLASVFLSDTLPGRKEGPLYYALLQ